MYRNKRILALIPARGGSKGLPCKNIKKFLGKPLMAWSIEQARKSRYIDEIIVSTDDEKIAKIAKKYKARVPFMRPKGLAKDNSSTIDVVLHAIDFMEKEGNSFDIIALLEPTSPLRDTEDIDKAITRLVSDKKARSIVGVSRVEAHHPDFLTRLEGGFLKPFMNKNFKVKRRQSISTLYFFEGSLYISFIDALKEKRNFYHKNALGYVMPNWKSYEVDDVSTFIAIKSLMNAKIKGMLK